MPPKTLPAGTVTPFQERVYALLQQIPEGRVATYAALARALGSSPRAVGGALRRNLFAPEVPCHRVLASTGVSLCIFRQFTGSGKGGGLMMR
jgi:methylated-DNA-[protein]-cysteine S-methyltransferase